MIWPLSSGRMSEAESISTMRRRQPGSSSTRRVSPQGSGSRLLGRAASSRTAASRQGMPARTPKRRGQRVGMAHRAARDHVSGIADAAARVRGRCRRHAQSLCHGEDGDARIVLADSRIVVDDARAGAP